MKKTKKSCTHQWFEIKRIVTSESVDKVWFFLPSSKNDDLPHSISMMENVMFGLLVICANCGLKKELWDKP